MHGYIIFLALFLFFGFLHLFVCTCTIEPPLGIPLLYATFSLSSLPPTENPQDKMHQGFYLGNQLTMKTSATSSTTRCNSVKLCLNLQTRNPFLDPLRLHETPQPGSLTMRLTYSITREPVKPLQPCTTLGS